MLAARNNFLTVGGGGGPEGQVEFTNPGTFVWTVPEESLVCVLFV